MEIGLDEEKDFISISYKCLCRELFPKKSKTLFRQETDEYSTLECVLEARILVW